MNEFKISKSRLEELEDAESMLLALQNGGVDNWEWYEESLKGYNIDKNFKKLIEDTITDIEVEILLEAFEPSERGAGYSTTDSARVGAGEILKRVLKEYFTINKEKLEDYEH